MEKYLKGSSTRLFSFILLIFFVIINVMAIYGYIWRNLELSFDFLTYDSMLLLSIFAPKYLHKYIETKK